MPITGQLTVGEISFASDHVQTDVDAWTVVVAGNLLEIISVDASTANTGDATHSFDVRDARGQVLVDARPIELRSPVKLGPYPAGARPRFDGLIIDTPTFTTGPIDYTIVYRPL